MDIVKAIIGGVEYQLPRLKWYWHRPVQKAVVTLLEDVNKLFDMTRTKGDEVKETDVQDVTGVMDTMSNMIETGLQVIAAGIKQNHDETLAQIRASGASVAAVDATPPPPTADDLARVLEMKEWNALFTTLGQYASMLVPQGEAGEVAPVVEGIAGTDELTPSLPN